MTLPPPAPTMQPESSDGFASVGTILPEERAALLPGGSFRFKRLICPHLPGRRPSLSDSVHWYPQPSHRHELNGFTPSSAGSAGSAVRTFRHFELGCVELRILHNLFGDWIGCDCASLFQLVGRNQHARIRKFRIPCKRKCSICPVHRSSCRFRRASMFRKSVAPAPLIRIRTAASSMSTRAALR